MKRIATKGYVCIIALCILGVFMVRLNNVVKHNKELAVLQEANNIYKQEKTNYLKLDSLRNRLKIINSKSEYTKDINELYENAYINNRNDLLYKKACELFTADSTDYQTLIQIRDSISCCPDATQYIKHISLMIDKAKSNNIPYQRMQQEKNRELFLGFKIGMTKAEYESVWRQNRQLKNINPYDNRSYYMKFGDESVSFSDCGQRWTEEHYYLYAEFKYAPIFTNGKLTQWKIVLWECYPDRAFTSRNNASVIESTINKQLADREYSYDDFFWSCKEFTVKVTRDWVPNGEYGNDLAYIVTYRKC